MKTTDYITVTIDRFPKGYVFTYADFTTAVNKKEAVIKALNRMVVSGKIAKLAKGKYYKPESTPFGNLEPNQYQVVKDLLEDDGKTIGYLTGYSIYNQLGLTTQISNTIQIARNDIRPSLNRDRYSIKFVKQKNTITKENIPLLQLLDAIRYIKRIPDSSTATACMRLMSLLKELSEKDIATVVRLAQKYPPATRALLGALLDEAGVSQFKELLLKNLNPITKYKLSGVQAVLKTAINWNLV
ncbi:type IV toxin-antitoxin system AbiEi family antitoxin domain-containing protein [Flavobacterium frigidarium]|uniref:type IV toxin-antitoxin system AbiEi family antitoxin domain-containing protein n=1 Tax=Flavobacterium frigidarium TaxID=99286 RepID=UPI00041F4291|nr:DUF6088 family protein [Flavobacterium frigidarium]